MRVLLLFLSGCNLAFPLSPAPTDGSPPPTDGPIGSVECPAPGITPQYGSELFTRASACSEYTEGPAGRGMAACAGSFAELAPDDPSTAMIPRFTSTPEVQYQSPRLAPEGDQLFMVVRDDATGSRTLQTSLESGAEWGSPSLITSPGEPDLLTIVLGVGTPSMGPTRRMMINVADGIHEVQLEGLTIQTITMYDSGTAFGITFVQTPNLTSDGLRAVGQAVTLDSADLRVFYFERTSLDLPFETAVPIDGAPISNDLFMTSNCARLYASSAGKVLFARQL